jgi:hypothetical protein
VKKLDSRRLKAFSKGSLFLFWRGEIGLWLGWFDWLLAGCVGLDKKSKPRRLG